MKTLELYLQEQIQECIDNNISYKGCIEGFKQEWFDMLCEHLKQSYTITQEIFDNLDDCQKWYINKHYLIQGIKCIA